MCIPALMFAATLVLPLHETAAGALGFIPLWLALWYGSSVGILWYKLGRRQSVLTPIAWMKHKTGKGRMGPPTLWRWKRIDRPVRLLPAEPLGYIVHCPMSVSDDAVVVVSFHEYVCDVPESYSLPMECVSVTLKLSTEVVTLSAMVCVVVSLSR